QPPPAPVHDHEHPGAGATRGGRGPARPPGGAGGHPDRRDRRPPLRPPVRPVLHHRHRQDRHRGGPDDPALHHRPHRMMRPIVQTAHGLLEGVTESDIHKFRGVPYAEPPVGRLRWRPPAPAATWTGVRTATEFGPICPQTAGAVFTTRAARESENCLYLNVWTRSLDTRARQPVMVWIHGGGYLGGGGCEDGTDGSQLAARGATVVSFNYRLGAFGYLASPELGSNFGVQGQIAALRWVRDNIEQFGGDPACVTIFAQSACAHSVRT